MVKINFYNWNDTPEDVKGRIMRRSGADIDGVIAQVVPIIEDVKKNGDDALRAYAQKFEGGQVTNIKASEEEFDKAAGLLDQDLKLAIEHCVRNVRIFHQKQMERVEQRWMEEIEPGVWAGEQVAPLDSVGLYVPRGKGAFPSAMYMLCVPAVLAGVKDIAVVSPPTPDGGADAASLYTARLCGVENVYKVGGAQAIAALAYGTDSVPKVRKVLGPGSPYVAAAKRVLSDVLDPGMPAGPSESIVLADGSADPYNCCLDILNEAEHGKDSAALFITHDAELAEYVAKTLPDVIAELPQPHREICETVMGEGGYGGIILTENLTQSVEISNEYAPEHLHLKVANAEEILPTILHAGEVLLGEYTPSSLGNYGIGVNHVLPTGGWAHSYSCTSVWDFLKRTSISKVDRQGYAALKGDVEILTDYEGFPAHGDVMRKRRI